MALGSTVEELQERMTSREFAEWIAYYSLEPFGQLRQDNGHALVASVVFNMLKAESVPPRDPDDFLLIFNQFDLDEIESQKQDKLGKKLEEILGGGNFS